MTFPVLNLQEGDSVFLYRGELPNIPPEQPVYLLRRFEIPADALAYPLHAAFKPEFLLVAQYIAGEMVWVATDPATKILLGQLMSANAKIGEWIYMLVGKNEEEEELPFSAENE